MPYIYRDLVSSHFLLPTPPSVQILLQLFCVVFICVCEWIVNMGRGQNGILEQVNSLCIHSFFSFYVDINYQLLMMKYNFGSLQRLIVLSCLFLVMFSSAVNSQYVFFDDTYCCYPVPLLFIGVMWSQHKFFSNIYMKLKFQGREFIRTVIN